jgi:hypothetical protein
MKLRDFGIEQTRDWFEQILQWSRKKITFEDNVDGVEVLAYIGTSDTSVPHALGRAPKSVIPIAKYPYGTAAIEFSQSKAPTNQVLYLKRAVAGYQWLRLE